MYGVPVVWADVENTTSVETLTSLGVDPSKLFLVKPKSPSEPLTIEYVTQVIKDAIEAFQKAEQPFLFIWDSLASTAAEQQLKDNYNPNQMGLL